MREYHHHRIPSFPKRFFKWYCDPRLQESILGDLEEQFEDDVSAYGVRKARRRFAWNVIRFCRRQIIKPASSRLNYLGMFRHNVKIGWRSILRKKTFSLINIIGLSTAAAVCLLTLIFYQYETSFDRHHRLAEKTYRVVQKTERPDAELFWGTTAYPLAAALREDLPDFEFVTQTAGPMNRLFSYTRANGKRVLFEEQHVLFVDQYYPQTFDFEWLSGNPKTALAELNAVVITEEIAQKCFGQDYNPSEVLGETLLLNNKDPLVVKGVIENNRPNINLKANMMVSYAFFKKHNPYPSGNWSGNYRGTTFLVLNDETQKIPVESKINEWKGKYLNEADNEIISYALQPLHEIHTETKYGTTPQGYQIPKTTLNASLMVALFILLIAIINFINLVTANASIRSKEVGIRKVIGGGKRIILSQFIIENTLLVSIAFMIAMGLAYFILDNVNAFLSIIDLDLSIRLSDILLVMVFCLMIALAATIYPSAVLASFNPINALSGQKTQTTKGVSLRKGLTFFQFTIVQVFVIAAIVVGVQLQFFQSKPTGFESDKVVAIPIPSFEGTSVFVNKLQEMSDVAQVSVASGPPMTVENFGLGTRYRQPFQDVNDGMSAEMKIIDSTYLDLYQIPLIAGRNIRVNKPRFDEFIVTRGLAASLNWTPQEALGKQLAINEGEAIIVGVVEDFNNQALQNDKTPVVMMNWQAWQWEASVKVSSFETLIEIEEIWRAQFPDNIFSYNFVDDSIEKEYVIENLIFTGFKYFSVLVIIIACLGLFGLVSFVTMQKTKEIGIRKVLGASITEILILFNRQFSLVILLAFAAAIPLVWYFMEEWLNTFNDQNRISLQGWMFAAGGLSTFILGSLVAILKSYKAASANPVEILKDE